MCIGWFAGGRPTAVYFLVLCKGTDQGNTFCVFGEGENAFIFQQDSGAFCCTACNVSVLAAQKQFLFLFLRSAMVGILKQPEFLFQLQNTHDSVINLFHGNGTIFDQFL